MAEKVKMLIPEEEVNARIEELGKKISEEYAGKQVHLICVLKGGVFFMCELAKRITVPVTMDFMSVSSYGDGTQSSGIVKIAKDLVCQEVYKASCSSVLSSEGCQADNKEYVLNLRYPQQQLRLFLPETHPDLLQS